MARSSGVQAAPEIPADTPLSIVAKHATQREALHLRNISLIGIVGPTAAPSALFRLKNGRILKLNVGDRSPGGTVAAIDAESIRLSRGGRIKTLSMPEG